MPPNPAVAKEGIPPQQSTTPPTVSAHAWLCPTAKCSYEDPGGVSGNPKLGPKHCTRPSSQRAQT